METEPIQDGSSPHLWQDCLRHLAGRVKKQTFHTWFEPIKAARAEDGSLILEVANQFAVDWLNQHFRAVISETVSEVAGHPLDIRLRVSADAAKMAELAPAGAVAAAAGGNGNGNGNGRAGDPQGNSPVWTVGNTGSSSLARGREAGLALNERYTFETFVVGDSNQFAHAASLAVAESGGATRFNPLYIYGRVGLGKTHLAQAVGHCVLELNPRAQVVYATSEKFTNDFISSLSAGNTAEFTRRYRTVDLLIVDDIQFFAGKESTQAQFFHTFNDLYQNGRRIVLTSDRPPREIQGLEERLLSRFGWGLVTDIQPPDVETRIAILKKKVENEQIQVPGEALEYIADHVTSNIRDLEGSLIRLLAYASLIGRDITLELTREVLRDAFSPNRPQLTIEAVQKTVASHFNLPLESMWTKKKTQEIVMARQIAMYLARELTSFPLKAIGAKFGGRDHSTVIHACSQVAARAKSDAAFKQHIDRIVNNLYS